ncbi:7051_t:CDS:1, partial [Acaulospora morrowiae]
MENYKVLIYKLLDPIPQYVLGCLPALGIIGESPANRFTEKVTWLLRCLGCPFTALFYSINIGSKKESRCFYWLSSSRFVTDKGSRLRYRPFGFNACEIQNADDPDIKKCVEQCTATASVLERWSSLVSAYFIVVGMLALISKATGKVSCPDWPYIPSLFSWTIPAICRRAFSGNIVIKDPDDIFKDHYVIVRENKNRRIHKRFTVFVTAFVAMFYPLITLSLAYYAPPIGYGCR